MRIFVAGASGAIGKRLVPMLAERGHEVTGATRSRQRAQRIRALGAEPVVVDALDAAALTEAVVKARAEVVVHQLTAIGALDARNFDKGFAATNRLRTMGTDNLLAAAREAGARRFVAQSYGGWPYERTGAWVKSEADRLDPVPPADSRETHAAIAYLEQAVTAAGNGIVLRYGGFYGPGTSLGHGGEVLDLVRKRRLPIVGAGTGVWSFIHIADAARATVAAIESDQNGVFNITDDEPAPVHDWLPYLARAVGAKPPLRVPVWLARLMLGEHMLSMMTRIRGASNAKAKAHLGFHLAYPSWRQGFQHGL